MAFTYAAVLKSTFLFKEVLMTYCVAELITYSNPAYTMSLSDAPSNNIDLSKAFSSSPVAFEITVNKFCLLFYYHLRCIRPGLT